MANLSLAQLRAKQIAEGTTDPEATDGTPAGGPLPIQASLPVPSVAPAPGAGGYLRIFPATFPSIGAIPQTWKDANWVGNGPWQNLEGHPMHPEFEANLALLEAE